jgi:hypothetical protein
MDIVARRVWSGACIPGQSNVPGGGKIEAGKQNKRDEHDMMFVFHACPLSTRSAMQTLMEMSDVARHLIPDGESGHDELMEAEKRTAGLCAGVRGRFYQRPLQA